ncbi:MAG: hypothetical protein U0T77_06085 [Chitinophagales bacterium]
MKELLKKSVYISIGTASVTNDKIKELLEDLIQNNHYTEEEGKRIVDTFLYDLRQQLDTMNASVIARIDEIFQKLGIPNFLTVKEDIERYVKDVKEDPTLLLKLPAKK